MSPTHRHFRVRLLSILSLALIGACVPGPLPAIRQSEATAPPQPQAQNEVLPAGTAMVAVRAAPSATSVPTPGPRLDDPSANLGVVAELGLGAPWAAVWSATGDQLRVLSPVGMQVLKKEGSVWTARGLFPEVGSDVMAVPIFWRIAHESLVRLDGLGHFRPAEVSLCSGVDGSVPWDFLFDPALLAYSAQTEWGGWQVNVRDLSSSALLGEYWVFPADLQLTSSASTVAVLQEGTGVWLFAIGPSGPTSHEPIGRLDDTNATAMAVSRSGHDAITISEYHVSRWDLSTQRLMETWEGKFPPNPVLAALKYGEPVIFDRQRAWILRSGGKSQLVEYEGHEFSLGRISQSGSRIVLQDAHDGEFSLVVLNASDMQLANEIRLPVPVHDFRFKLDDRKLSAIACDGRVAEIDLETGQIAFIQGLSWSGPVSDLAFSPDGGLLAVASPGWPVRLWDWAGQHLIEELDPGGALLQFGPAGNSLAVASEHDIALWDLAQGTEIWRVVDPPSHAEAGFPFEALRFTPEGDILVSDRESLYRIDGESGALLWQVAHAAGISARVLISDQGEIVLVNSYPNQVDIRSGQTGEFRYSFSSFRQQELALAISPDLREVATASEDEIRMWAIETGEELRALDAPSSWGLVTAMAYSADGTLLAIGTSGGLALAQPLKGRVHAILDEQTELISAIDFSPTGDLLAAGSLDGSVRLWGAVPASP